MRLIYKQLLLTVSLLIALSACRNDMEQTPSIQLSLCLPSQQHHTTARRVIGDPGTTEQFNLPKYAYIFVLKQNGVNWTVWRYEERQLNPEHWVATTYKGHNSTLGDSIYKYDRPIQFFLRNETLEGRVYTICSSKKLTFSSSMASITSLDDLLNWKFDTSPDSIQQNLQDIYTTPYNYMTADRYYCTFDCSAGNSSYVDLLLYHLASKVDLQWNVADTARVREDPSKAVRLTYMEARRLFNGMAYCFKPMRNTLATLPTSGGYTIPNIVMAADEGLWWEGRAYFYTIPYTVTDAPDYFPLQLMMRTNGSAGTGYQLTLNQPIDTADIFVPWIRGRLTFTKPLEDKSETKNIGD